MSNISYCDGTNNSDLRQNALHTYNWDERQIGGGGWFIDIGGLQILVQGLQTGLCPTARLPSVGHGCDKSMILRDATEAQALLNTHLNSQSWFQSGREEGLEWLIMKARLGKGKPATLVLYAFNLTTH